jgi:hypothetical protein
MLITLSAEPLAVCIMRFVFETGRNPIPSDTTAPSSIGNAIAFEKNVDRLPALEELGAIAPFGIFGIDLRDDFMIAARPARSGAQSRETAASIEDRIESAIVHKGSILLAQRGERLGVILLRFLGPSLVRQFNAELLSTACNRLRVRQCPRNEEPSDLTIEQWRQGGSET